MFLMLFYLAQPRNIQVKQYVADGVGGGCGWRGGPRDSGRVGGEGLLQTADGRHNLGRTHQEGVPFESLVGNH
jgi:hypothetical protein